MYSTVLRINEYLEKRVKLLAKKNNMSINSQLIELIELGLSQFDENFNNDYKRDVKDIKKMLELLTKESEVKNKK